MITLDKINEILQKSFENLTFKTSPSGLYESIQYILSMGGKRIRPVLVLAGYNLFKNDIEKAIPVAMAFEVFHNFTLMHDDVMDNSTIRRNKPTVHVKWNVNTAILSGDAMLIKAYQILFETKTEKIKEVAELFSKTAMEVCEGQQFDMNFETLDNVSTEQYIEMIRLKTSVLLAACVKAGAMVADADTESCNLLYQFGLNTGLAFQLQDDLLDVYGDLSVFGKQPGGDILNDKKTFLMIKAIELSSGNIKKELSMWRENKTSNPELKIKEITNIYNKLGIKELTLNKISEYHKLASNALSDLKVESNKKEILNMFLEQIMSRNK